MTTSATPEDLELDRLAAKAAGIHLHHWNADLQRWMTSSVPMGDPDGSWNARDDDGDAWRLMVRLKIDFGFGSTCVWAQKSGSPNYDDVDASTMRTGNNRSSACRRVIVISASQIGRRMP